MLREFYKRITEGLGIELADFGINVGEQDSARSHVEFASALVTKIFGSDPSRDEDPVSFLKKIKCPTLCIYGEKDYPIQASGSAGIVRNAFADTSHDDYFVKVFPGAGHQLEIAEGGRTSRHRDFDKYILDWVQKRVRKN
jgi:pimeloyl-ACP methyl ester carboxylesterase